MDERKVINQSNIDNIKKLIGSKSEIVVRTFIVGNKNFLEAAIMYVNGLADVDVIDRDILKPLMLHVAEDLTNVSNIEDYIYKKYVAVSDTYVEGDVNKAADSIKRGKTVIIMEGASSFIVVNTTGGTYRAISEPHNDPTLRGPKEGFIENLETNISLLSRKIKDKNLVTEKYVLGRRSQTDLVIMYIDDIVDKGFLNRIREKIETIDIDSISSDSFIEQCIEEHPYSIFPQVIASERPDVVQSKLMEGRIAFLLDGSPFVSTYPTVMAEFFQTTEDYYERSIIGSFIRIVRLLAVFIVITVPSIYITLIKFNAELIPIEFVESLIKSRKGIALTPFMSLLAMQLTIEFLREGGLRLPSKIGQTLSVVGGIIIGDAALNAKIVSSSTLLVAGITTVASFAISDYQMAISIRIISYLMLIMSNWLGMLGIVIGWLFIIAYLSSMNNFGVPYVSFRIGDIKDIFIRAPLWTMKNRPEGIPHKDSKRQSIFRRR